MTRAIKANLVNAEGSENTTERERCVAVESLDESNYDKARGVVTRKRFGWAELGSALVTQNAVQSDVVLHAYGKAE